MTAPDREAAMAMAALQRIHAAGLDRLVPTVISTAAAGSTAILAVYHFCRWWWQ